MILDRQKLVRALATLGCSVGNKIMKVADFVQFRLSKEHRKLFMSTTNFTSFMTIDYGDLGLANIDDFPELFLLEYKMINSILKMSTTKDVDIRQDKPNGPIIVVTNGKYELQRYGEVSEFPACEYDGEKVATIPVHQLEGAWNRASVAVSKDVTKLAYQGVNFDGNFVATDNHRVSIARAVEEYNGPTILLHPIFGEIIKCCKNYVEILHNEQSKKIVIVCQEVGLVASIRLIDAKFVDYKLFFNMKKDAIKITFNKNDLVGVLQRLQNFTDQIFKVVQISIQSDGEKITAQFSVENKSAGSEQISSSKFELPDEMKDFTEGDLISSAYHIENLLDGIIVSENAEEVTFNIQEDNKLWIEEESYNYLLTNIKQQ